MQRSQPSALEAVGLTGYDARWRVRLIALLRSLKPYVIVFTASGCTLIIEIVAGRILAPTIGVSLYTWTSIIGIVLAGISVGNYIGGRVADRYPSPSTVGLILFAGGVTSLGIIPVDHYVSDSFLTLPIIPRIVMLTIVLFIVPAIILGMVTPVVIKLRLADLAETGNVVGKMYSGRFLRSVVHTLQRAFPHVYVMRDDPRWDSDDRYTFIVAASNVPITAVQVTSANLFEGRGTPVTQFMPEEMFASWIVDERKVVLTDDFVPVDGMLAPLYLESRTQRE